MNLGVDAFSEISLEDSGGAEMSSLVETKR